MAFAPTHCLPSILTPTLLSFFCSMLDFQEVSIILAILDAVEKIFEKINNEFTGLQENQLRKIVSDSSLGKNLEALQDHPAQKVFERSRFLLESYFDIEEK